MRSEQCSLLIFRLQRKRYLRWIHNRNGNAPQQIQQKEVSTFMLTSRMRMSGLEPMTPCMSSRYSNQLSYTLTTKTIISYYFLFVNP